MTKEYIKIKIEGGTYKTLHTTPRYENRKQWQPRNPKQVISFIPGTIMSINVSVGSKVKEGDLLLSFNAMKMNSDMVSDISGTVKTIAVSVGDRIPKNTLMIEFE